MAGIGLENGDRSVGFSILKLIARYEEAARRGGRIGVIPVGLGWVAVVGAMCQSNIDYR
jgi:hypothetical protein